MSELLIGLDLGATNILYGVANLDGDILYKNTVPTNHHKGLNNVLDKISAIIIDLISKYEAVEPIKNIVLATPGPLSYPDKIVLNSPNLNWHEVALEKEMQTRLNRPIIVEKDTNLAALAVYLFEEYEKENLIYITVSTGVGAGLFINGNLYRGSTGGAGEFGHMVVQAQGRVCGCGRYGCLEAIASGTAIAQEAYRSGLFPLQAENLGSKEVGDLARQGNLLAKSILDNAVEHLAIGIANLVNIFNPQIIVLGGGVILGLEDLWLEKLTERVLSSAFALNTRDLRLEVTRLGEDIGLYGCIGRVKNF